MVGFIRSTASMSGARDLLSWLGRTPGPVVSSYPPPDVDDRPGGPTPVGAVAGPPTSGRPGWAELLSARDLERSGLARELHDIAGQALTAVRLGLLAINRVEPSPAVAGEVAGCIDLVDEAIQAIRGLSAGMRPSLVDDVGLAAATRSLVAREAARGGYVGFVVGDPGDALDRQTQIAIYRILQEALTNVARHAHATQVTIEFRPFAAGIEVQIADDGAGFDTSRIADAGASPDVLGLIGMSERAELVGGSVRFDSTVGEGTVVSVRIPVRALGPADGPR